MKDQTKNNLFTYKQWQVLLLAVLLSLIGGWFDFTIDKLIGDDISFNIFYLLPVGLAAWFVGTKSGVVISVFSSFVCYFADVVFNSVKRESILLPLWNSAAGLVFFLCFTVLLSALKNELGLHKTLSMEDFLTKASNGRAFFNYLRIEMARIKRYQKPITLVYLDLDNFKQVNDTKGHTVGDELLVAFVNCLRKNIRATDAVSRLGGDEFAILLPEMTGDMAVPFMEKLKNTVYSEMKKLGWDITYSAGVVTCNAPPENVNELIKDADNLMYAVKKNGKNGVKFSTCG